MTTRLLIAAALVSVLAGGCSSNGQEKPGEIPAASPETLHGTIAFSTQGGDIWLMNADGSERRRLTHSGPDIDFDPDSSPDGLYAVFRTLRVATNLIRTASGLKASSSSIREPGVSVRFSHRPGVSSPPVSGWSENRLQRPSRRPVTCATRFTS
jgi:hypothetical protein